MCIRRLKNVCYLNSWLTRGVVQTPKTQPIYTSYQRTLNTLSPRISSGFIHTNNGKDKFSRGRHSVADVRNYFLKTPIELILSSKSFPFGSALSEWAQRGRVRHACEKLEAARASLRVVQDNAVRSQQSVSCLCFARLCATPPLTLKSSRGSWGDEWDENLYVLRVNSQNCTRIYSL